MLGGLRVGCAAGCGSGCAAGCGSGSGLSTGPTYSSFHDVAWELFEKSFGDATRPGVTERAIFEQPRSTGHLISPLDSAGLPAATTANVPSPPGRYLTVQYSKVLLEMLTDDDEHDFEYESLALPPPSGVSVYSELVPALGSTSHTVGSVAVDDCILTRPDPLYDRNEPSQAVVVEADLTV